jgi:hypothetical protein
MADNHSMLKGVCIIASILFAGLAGPGAGAREAPLEASHLGVHIEARPAQTDAYYEVELISTDEAIERLRKALNLIVKKSSFGASALEKLRKSGYVIIIYDPSFPRGVASRAGTVLAAFAPDLAVGDRSSARKYPFIVGRYIVKWTTEGFASTLVHELAHGVQHMEGRMRTMDARDRECEADLHQERALQDFGADKRSEQVVRTRQALQLFTCVPFRKYMAAHTPEKMELWNTLNPDVPQLLSIFKGYLKSK